MSSEINYSKRVFGLDILRCIAIFFVLIDHAGYNPFPKIMLGTIGVDLFFVLSGYLIGGIILSDFENFKGISTVLNFWKRRWFRTIPLYYLALVIQIIIKGKWITSYLLYFFFLQNNFFGLSLYGVSWSLVIEEWFYLMLPFLLWFILIVFSKIDLKGLIMVYLLFIVFKILYIQFKEIPLSAVNGNILLRADSIFIGVFIAFFKKHNFSLIKQLAKKKILISVFLLMALFYFFCFYIIGITTIEKNVLTKAFFYTIQSLFIASTIPYLLKIKYKNENNLSLIQKFIIWSSVLSYSFYLFHMNIYNLINIVKLSAYIDFPLKLITIYFLCYLVYNLFEKPITELREKI